VFDENRFDSLPKNRGNHFEAAMSSEEKTPTPCFDLHHGLDVANRVQAYTTDPSIIMAALLHDAVEDGVVEAEELRAFGTCVQTAVSVLTRRPSWPYHSYIEFITMASKGVRYIKIADLEANLARMDPDHESLRPRYEKALTRLRSSIEEER
jgi:(p)ppGpp synthase/HD superfamily hydrolase